MADPLIRLIEKKSLFEYEFLMALLLICGQSHFEENRIEIVKILFNSFRMEASVAMDAITDGCASYSLVLANRFTNQRCPKALQPTHLAFSEATIQLLKLCLNTAINFVNGRGWLSVAHQ